MSALGCGLLARHSSCEAMSAAARFGWNESERPPLCDGFLACSTLVNNAKVGELCEVVRKAVVRDGSNSITERRGELHAGQRVTCLEIKQVNGQQRVRFDQRYDEDEAGLAGREPLKGWTSLRSKKDAAWLLVAATQDRDARSVDYHVSFPPKEGGAEDAAPPELEHFCLPTVAEVISGKDRCAAITYSPRPPRFALLRLVLTAAWLGQGAVHVRADAGRLLAAVRLLRAHAAPDPGRGGGRDRHGGGALRALALPVAGRVQPAVGRTHRRAGA